MLQSFKRAYDLRLWVKCLTWLVLLATTLLLLDIAGGFPPLAWRVLAQSTPRFALIVSARGLDALAPFAGLLVLSITWAALWLMLAWIAIELLWRAWFPPRRASRQAKSWRRSSLDNLLDSGYDEPQASLAYASAHASFDKIASPTTPPPEIRIYPSTVSKRATRPPSKSKSNPPSKSAPKKELPVNRPLAVATHDSRPPGRARPASRPPLERRHAPTEQVKQPREQEIIAGEHRGQAHTYTATFVPADLEDSMGLIDSTKNVGIGWDVGITRRQKPNEDSVLVLHGTCTFRGRLVPLDLFAVADGMGGHASGQVASHLATHSLMQNVLPTIQHGDQLSEKFLVDTMVDCAHWANQAIFKYREEHDVDLGTTLTAALVVESTACIVNVGDSRTYLYRAGEGLRQITRDHSLVARLVATGLITAEEVYTHPDRNKVYRALGEKDDVQVDWFSEPVQPGDLLLLCSDGLWELVRDHEIEKILQRCQNDAPQAADALVKAALHRGGTDNVSVLVARV